MVGKLLKSLSIFTTSCFLLSIFTTNRIWAKEIRVSGFNQIRSSSPLAGMEGGPYIPFSFPTVRTDMIYGTLHDPNRFGQDGIVSCGIDYQIPVKYIESHMLVNNDGSRNADIFIAGTTEQALSNEEIGELSDFLLNGGIVFVADYDDHKVYNDLLINLGLEDRFGNMIEESGFRFSSFPIVSTYSVNGPFGEVGSIKHNIFRAIDVHDTNPVFQDVISGKVIVAEKNIGKGYLVLAGAPLYINYYWTQSYNVMRYMWNFFAMACDDSWRMNPASEPDVLLDVPSYRQNDPTWADTIYDSGNKQALWCGDTINECGCALTSGSMLLAYHDIMFGPGGFTINPKNLNTYFSQDETSIGDIYKSFGYYWGNVIWSRFATLSAMAHSIYPNQTKLDHPIISNYSYDDLKYYLDQGLPVILKVFNSLGTTHWVVAKGYIGDEIIINDPLTPNPEEGYLTLSQLNYVPQLIKSMIIYKPTNSDYSSIEVFTKAPDKVEFPGSEEYFDPSYYAPENEGVNVYRLLKPGEGEYEIRPQNGADYSVLVTNSEAESYSFDIFVDEIFRFKYNPEDQQPLFYEGRIDVRPEMERNLINLRSRGLVRVVLYSDEFIAASSIKANQVEWEGAVPFKSRNDKDIDKDGQMDIVLYFRISDTNIEEGQNEACLRANYKGLPIKACDNISTIPSNK